MTVQHVWAGSNAPEAHDAIQKWVSQHSFGHPNNTWVDSTSLGVLKNNVPIAGVIYHDYKPRGGTVQYSGAATDSTWLMGATLHKMFSYMFDDLGCQMVMTGNAESNKHLHHLLEITDHKLHVIERGWSADEALYLWTLTREQWESNPIMKRSRKWAETEQ